MIAPKKSVHSSPKADNSFKNEGKPAPQNKAKAQALFLAPDDFFLAGMRALPQALDAVMPMKYAHRKDLPHAVRDLSAQLTTERHQLSRPYWTSPRLSSAYLRYFLPWNLIRLGALLPGLPLSMPAPALSANKNSELGVENPVLLDLGSGPLTLPLALWLSRPDLRALPLHVIATDLSPHILNSGQALFLKLKETLAPDCAWTISTLRTPLHGATREIRERARWITMGNVLNEWDEAGQHRGQAQDRLQTLLEQLDRGLHPGGQILAIEPGTRLGGKMITNLRAFALNRRDADGEPEFETLAPCPHNRTCPMQNSQNSAWCHMNAPAAAVPPYLRDLSQQAGMDKDSVSLSFLLLRKSPAFAPSPASVQAKGNPKPGITLSSNEHLPARVISEPFTLPSFPGRARYACTAQGLALIPNAAPLPSGCLTSVLPTPNRDAKSGAKIMSIL